jgi:inner membrane protein
MSMQRPVAKIATIAGVAVVLLVCISLVTDLVYERRARQDSAATEVAESWGNAQRFSGPQLRLEHHFLVETEKGKVQGAQESIFLLPDSIDMRFTVSPQRKSRGIYDVILYETKVQYVALFRKSTLQSSGYPVQGGSLSKAELVLPITDPRSFSKAVTATVQDETVEFIPGNRRGFSANKELVAQLPKVTESSDDIVVKGELVLRGTETLSFVPTGKVTHVEAQGSWSDPGFSGSWLPKHRITDRDFVAEWRITYYGREFGQVVPMKDVELENSQCTITLHDPVNSYVKTERSVKYVAIVIALTFALFFVLELVSGSTIHPMQYLLVGLSLVMFYVLLLGISEFMVFNTAYGIAAVATVMAIALYMKALLRNGMRAALVMVSMGGLYGFVFVLLSLEEYSLLIGSIGAFSALCGVMYATRGVDWSGGATKRGFFSGLGRMFSGETHRPQSIGGQEQTTKAD